MDRGAVELCEQTLHGGDRRVRADGDRRAVDLVAARNAEEDAVGAEIDPVEISYRVVSGPVVS